METRAFDPAEYLDSEAAIAAYLADARAHGRDELADAAAVVARARAMLRGRAEDGVSPNVAPQEGVGEAPGPGFRRDSDQT